MSLVKNSKKIKKKNGNHAGAQYVNKLSVPGIQCRAVRCGIVVGFRAQDDDVHIGSGSIVFNNLRRDRGVDFHFIFNIIVDIYILFSTVKDGDRRVVEIR